MNPKTQFDRDYAIVRRQVLRKKTLVSTAKLWLKTHGEQTILAMQADQELRTMKQCRGSDKEIDRIKKYEKTAYGDLEDDE